jgi:pilus assembly protein CpaE
MYSAKVFLALQDGALKTEALAALGETSEDFSVTQQNPEDWAALLTSLAACQPDALLLDIGCLKGDVGAAVRDVQARSPQTKVVAMHALSDSESILAAMRAGASEFVQPPFAATLFPALKRLHDSAHFASGKRKGKLIAFLSAKGGCGSTTLACHIAAEMQRQTRSDVLLADFDFTSGAVGFLMKSKCTYSVIDGIKNLSRLDESLWKAMIDQSRPGLSVIPAPVSIAHGEYPEGNEFKQILRFMRTMHDWTIIDLGRSLTRTARAVLEEVDQMFLVATLEVIALHGVKTIVRGLSGDEPNLQKLHLILNRTPKMMDITSDELEKILGRPLFATLPNDYPGLYHSYSAGTLLPAKNRLGEHFARLASRIAGKEIPGAAKKRFALFG